MPSTLVSAAQAATQGVCFATVPGATVLGEDGFFAQSPASWDSLEMPTFQNVVLEENK